MESPKSSHSLQNLPALEIPSAENQDDRPRERTATRVRLNSRATEIPRSRSRTPERNSGSDQSQTPPAGTDGLTVEAAELLRAHSQHNRDGHSSPQPAQTNEGLATDEDEYAVTGSNQGGVFYQLLQSYRVPAVGANASFDSYTTPTSGRPGSSGVATPRRKWYEQNKPVQSQDTLATLIGASTKLANPNEKNDSGPEQRRGHKRNSSGNKLAMAWKAKEDQDAKIKIHIADIIKRQRYIIRMCKALMLFGAPTHRLEEYLAMTAKVLEVNSQFLYVPGCMIISFDDNLTHTAEVKMVRSAQSVNLGKLKDTHEIYKEVLHDVIDLDEALSRLDDIINSKDQHPVWLNVIMYGLASAAVSVFFKARLIDMPVILAMGTLLGGLQLVIAPMSKTYSTVFEISASILMAFLARAFGSIRGGNLFCFSALAQSGIAMILPGWLVLSSALELQSKAIVPGSIRLIYAVIYSLFLGYGITVGVALYGAIDSNATDATTCQNPLNSYWNFLFVPLYVFFTTFTVQAKYKQMPIMIAIALVGYIVNFYANMKFSASAPIAYTFGALAVGILANLYSRLRHGVAAAVLLPAVYVQVPGSLASSGAISSALTTASSLIKGSGNSTESASSDSTYLNTVSFNVAASMIQIAIGITVGLFMSALFVYPLGKRRSGLWTL